MTELLDPREAMVDIYCKQLKLPGLKQSFRELARDAMMQNQTPVSFLAACLAKEVDLRHQKRLNSRLKKAKFHEVKTLESLISPVLLSYQKQRLSLWQNVSS